MPRTGDRHAPGVRSGQTASGASHPLRKLDDAGADDGKLVVLVAGLLLDFDKMTPVFDKLAGYTTVDKQRVSFGIVTPDLARGATQHPLIAHPVGQMVGQP